MHGAKDIEAFQVASRARDCRVRLAHDFKGLLGPVFELFQDITPHVIVLDDAFVLEPAIPSFELRFHHRDDEPVRADQARDRRQDFAQRDEGHVGDSDIDVLVSAKLADIGLLVELHARIIPERPVELIGTNVYRNNFAGTMLQGVISEPARRAADIKDHQTGKLETERLRGPRQFETSPADVLIAWCQCNIVIVGHQIARLNDYTAINVNSAQADITFGLAARRRQAPRDDRLVQPTFFHTG